MSCRAILLVLLATGCRSGYWRAAPVTSDQMLAATHPKRIRLTLGDSSVVVLKNPKISGDSIAGESAGKRIAITTARIVHTEVPPGLETTEAMFTSWRSQRRAPQQVISTQRPGRVRLTLRDSSVLVLEHPVSVGDSVVGFVSRTRTAVWSTDIVRTEIRVENSWKALGFGTLLVSGYAVLYFALCRGSPDCPNQR